MRLSKKITLAMLAFLVFPCFNVIMGGATFTGGDRGEGGKLGSYLHFIRGSWEAGWKNYLHTPLQGWRPTITWNKVTTWNKTGSWGMWNVSWNKSDLWNETVVWSRWTVEKPLGLRCAIDRALRFIDRINATTERLEEDGYVDEALEIREKLMEANTSLTILKEQLESGEITTEAATQELAKARGILGEAMRLLFSVTKKVKTGRLEKFFQRVENCIGVHEINIGRFQHMFKNRSVRLSALSDIRENLMGIRELLVAGNVQDALNELDSTVNRIDLEINKLNWDGASSVLIAVNRLEVRIQVLRASVEWWVKKGEDIAQVEAELKYAEALLDEIRALLEAGDLDGAEELVEEAEGHLEDAGEIIRSYVHSHQFGKGYKSWRTWKNGSDS